MTVTVPVLDLTVSASPGTVSMMAFYAALGVVAGWATLSNLGRLELGLRASAARHAARSAALALVAAVACVPVAAALTAFVVWFMEGVGLVSALAVAHDELRAARAVAGAVAYGALAFWTWAMLMPVVADRPADAAGEERRGETG